MSVLVMVAGAFGTSLFGGVAQTGTEGAVAGGASEALAQSVGFADAMLVSAAFALLAFLLSFVFRSQSPPMCQP